MAMSNISSNNDKNNNSSNNRSKEQMMLQHTVTASYSESYSNSDSANTNATAIPALEPNAAGSSTLRPPCGYPTPHIAYGYQPYGYPPTQHHPAYGPPHAYPPHGHRYGHGIPTEHHQQQPINATRLQQNNVSITTMMKQQQQPILASGNGNIGPYSDVLRADSVSASVKTSNKNIDPYSDVLRADSVSASVKTSNKNIDPYSDVLRADSVSASVKTCNQNIGPYSDLLQKVVQPRRKHEQQLHQGYRPSTYPYNPYYDHHGSWYGSYGGNHYPHSGSPSAGPYRYKDQTLRKATVETNGNGNNTVHNPYEKNTRRGVELQQQQHSNGGGSDMLAANGLGLVHPQPQKRKRRASILNVPPQVASILNVPPQAIGTITDPNVNDVLSGRGARINKHAGNVQLRSVIQSQKSDYLRQIAIPGKAHIIAGIVNAIRARNPPGRFLQQDKGTGLWFEIGDAKAYTKTGQGLREAPVPTRIIGTHIVVPMTPPTGRTPTISPSAFLNSLDLIRNSQQATAKLGPKKPYRKSAAQKLKELATTQLSKTVHTLVGNPDWYPSISMSETSEYYQDGGSGGDGRKTIANAIQADAGWNTAEFSKTPEATKILEEHPGLREQIANCTIVRCMNADTTDPQYQELYALIMNVLTIENTNDYHSLLRQVRKMKHANKHKNPQLYAAYDAVDKLLKIKATRAASSFRCNPKKTDNYPNLTLDEMLVFLGDHMDANRLSALFASLSSEESQVCYMIDGVVVATLTVPAGLSLIYTTEIHSGSKTLNPFGLKHFSRCGRDRLLFRIVHEVPDGGFDLTQKDLVAKIILAYKAIHNLN